MKEFLKADEGAKELLEMIYAPMYTKVLFAGIELDLFSELEEFKSYIEIAEESIKEYGLEHRMKVLSGNE